MRKSATAARFSAFKLFARASLSAAPAVYGPATMIHMAQVVAWLASRSVVAFEHLPAGIRLFLHCHGRRRGRRWYRPRGRHGDDENAGDPPRQAEHPTLERRSCPHGT